METYGQVSVSRHEEEVVVNELLSDSLIHASEWVVLASKVSRELSKSAGHHLLNVNSLLLGDSGRETESINVTSDTDTGGVDWDTGLNVANNLLWVHVRGVLGISGDSVVILDDGIEDLGEVLVGVPVTSVDSCLKVLLLLDKQFTKNLGTYRNAGCRTQWRRRKPWRW